jgi:hypothetical protein
MAFGIALQVDLLAPVDQDALETARKEEAKTMADWSSAPMVRDDTPKETVEQRCFAHAMMKRAEKEVTQEDLWGSVQGEELSDY